MCPDDRTDTREDQRQTEWGREPDEANRRREGPRSPGSQGTYHSRSGGSLTEGFSTPINALIGGVAGLVLSFIPFSTALGGAVAGYLDAGPVVTDDAVGQGLFVGAFAGALGFLPFLLFGYAVLGFLSPLAGAPVAAPLYVLLLAVGLYFVGLSAVGGVVGVVVYHKQHDDRRP